MDNCSNNINGIFKLFTSEVEGDSLDYFVSGDTIVADVSGFSEIQIQDDLSTFVEKKVVDAKGSYFNNNFDLTIHQYSSEIPHSLDGKKLAVIFQDSEGYKIAGYEQPLSIDKIEETNDTRNNIVKFNIAGDTYQRAKLLGNTISQTCTLEIDSIDIEPTSLTDYNVAINASGNNGFIYYSLNGGAYQISNAFLTLTANTYSITAKDSNVIGGCFASTGFTVGSDFNSVSSLSAMVSLNSIVLHWVNPAYSVPVHSYRIIRINPLGHPSGTTTEFIINTTLLTGFTDTNVGTIPGTYQYWVQVCEQTGGTKGHQFKSVSQAITNYNIPFNLTGTTSGNDIILTWSNPSYTIPIKSYVLNRLNPSGHPSGSSTLLIFNSTGATTFTDVNVAQFGGGLFQYQIAVATNTGGTGRQTFSTPLIGITISNTNTPPFLELTGVFSATTKYYGSWDIKPQLMISGGSGTVSVLWTSSVNNLSVTTQSQSLTLSGGIHYINLNLDNRARAFGTTSTTYRARIIPTSGYTTGGTVLTFTLPHRLQSPITASTVSQVGADVHFSWSAIKTDSGSTSNYGYVVRRYLTSDFSGTITTLGYVPSGTLTYTDVSAPHGNYSYYCLGASLNGQDISTYCSDNSPIQAITIT